MESWPPHHFFISFLIYEVTCSSCYYRTCLNIVQPHCASRIYRWWSFFLFFLPYLGAASIAFLQGRWLEVAMKITTNKLLIHSQHGTYMYTWLLANKEELLRDFFYKSLFPSMLKYANGSRFHYQTSALSKAQKWFSN